MLGIKFNFYLIESWLMQVVILISQNLAAYLILTALNPFKVTGRIVRGIAFFNEAVAANDLINVSFVFVHFLPTVTRRLRVADSQTSISDFVRFKRS